MSSTNERTYNSDWLAWEQENHYSREKITIAESQTIVKGQVMGKITASGEYAVYNQDASDGTEAAAAIALNDCTIGSGETVDGAAIVRDAIVVKDKLTFPSDIEAAEQAAAMAELKALGIIARSEV